MLNEIINTFSYILIPFIVVTLFSLFLPSIGSFLYLRNEIILSLTIPPVAVLFIIINTIIGFSLTSTLFLIITSIETFLAFYLSEHIKLQKNKRELFYASFFTISNFLTPLLISVFPSANFEETFLLKGELLSINKEELIISVLLTIGVFFLLSKFKNAIFSFCIDEEMIQLRTKHFKFFSFFYKMILILTITISTVFIGPLLTTSLLIIPCFFSGLKSNSIKIFLVRATFIGVTGSILGFFLSIVADIPPAYSSCFVILCCGLLWMVIISLSSAT